MPRSRPAVEPARLQAELPDHGVSKLTVEKLCELFKVLSDGSRFRIVLALAQKGQMNVSALRDLLDGQSQPAVSHHLALMRSANLVRRDRQGKHNFYRLELGAVRELLRQLLAETGGAEQLKFDDFAISLGGSAISGSAISNQHSAISEIHADR